MTTKEKIMHTLSTLLLKVRVVVGVFTDAISSLFDKFKKTPKTGLEPSPPDDRDYTVEKIGVVVQDVGFPTEFRVAGSIPDMYNQGQTSSCVAFSLKLCREIQEIVEHNHHVKFSPGYIYGNGNPVGYGGNGMVIRYALDSLIASGACPEPGVPLNSDWRVCKANITQAMHDLAAHYKIKAYARVAYSEPDMKSALMQKGPIVFGFYVYPSFYNTSKTTGIAPNPQIPGETYNGAHAMVIIGWKYIDGKLYWEAQNSWGTGWGKKGIYYLEHGKFPIFEFWSMTDDISPAPLPPPPAPDPTEEYSFVSVSNIVPPTYKLDVTNTGTKTYTDRAFVITELATRYVGLPLVQTVNDDKSIGGNTEVLRFFIDKKSKVFVCYDPRIKTKPSWMADWVENGDKVKTTDTKLTFSVYEKVFEPGEVILGGNGGSSSHTNYFVIVGGVGQSVPDVEPEPDPNPPPIDPDPQPEPEPPVLNYVTKNYSFSLPQASIVRLTLEKDRNPATVSLSFLGGPIDIITGSNISQTYNLNAEQYNISVSHVENETYKLTIEIS
jgi:hypothetical protein